MGPKEFDFEGAAIGIGTGAGLARELAWVGATAR